jgi:uncharacterized metal-binding protein
MRVSTNLVMLIVSCGGLSNYIEPFWTNARVDTLRKRTLANMAQTVARHRQVDVAVCKNRATISVMALRYQPG